MTVELTAIVTIYKVEDYLEKCLMSLQKQTYKSFNALLVVGAGDDVCINICNKYAESDKRFRVVVTEPKGLSDARNKGISLTETAYITFVDGDDYLPNDSFERLMNGIEKHDCEIAIGSYLIDYGEEKKIVRNKFTQGVLSNKEALINFLNGHDIQFVVAWGKIYKTSIFKDNKIVYPVGKLHEDNLTTYRLLYNARKIAYISEAVYCYVDREGSLSNNTNLDKEKVVIDDISFMREYLSSIDGIISYIDAYEIGAMISYLLRVVQHKDVKMKDYFEVVNLIKNKNVLKMPRVRMRMKLLCVFLFIFPGISYKLFKIKFRESSLQSN